MTLTTRICRKCGRELPTSAFPPDRPSRVTPGLMTRVYTCRDCAAFRRSVLRGKPKPVTGERRVCRTCRKEKPLSQFHKTNRGTREWQCKRCKQACVTARRRWITATDPVRAAALRARHTKAEQTRRLRRAMRRTGRSIGR